MRMSGGRRAISRRSSLGVSPVRLATLIRGAVAAEALGGQADAGQRRPEVALDVVGQRLERGDVQDADVAGVVARRRRARVAGQAVQCVQEGGQGLATPRRGVDERVVAAGDGRPALGLGLGRRLEARLEPAANGGRERRERVGDDDRSHGTSSIGCPSDLDHLFGMTFRGHSALPTWQTRTVPSCCAGPARPEPRIEGGWWTCPSNGHRWWSSAP